MKRLHLPIALLILALAGCSATAGKSGNILGSWENKMKFGSMTSTFNADGTFRTKTFGLGGQTLSGTYKLEGNNLFLNPTARFSSDPRIVRGFEKEPLKPSNSRIEFEGTNSFTIFDGSNKIKFVKIPENSPEPPTQTP